MLVEYYRALCTVVRSSRNGAYLYGGDEMGLWSMVTLLRNMPARRESEENCPSQVFRELSKTSSSKAKLFWRKQLMWNCMIWISALLGLVSSLFFSFVLRRCEFLKCYRMLLFRPDLVVFASQNYWGRKFGDYFGGDKQFTSVDLSRVYSLVIRSAYHIVDINNNPEQGRLEDKKHFSDMAKLHGTPAVPVIDPDLLLTPPSDARAETLRFPLFAKPRRLQWGQGVLKLESRDQEDFRDLVAKGSELRETHVIQSKLSNVADLQDYFPERAPLCTARITTFCQGGGREFGVLESWIRVGASGALADQIENGGSTFAVHAETGVVWNGTTTERMVYGSPHLEPSLRSAPGAAKSITGHKLPHWDRCLAAVKEAHARLAKDAFTVGWDVVFTPAGIQILEGNLMSMVGLHIGMRYGTMALVWPESPLIWLALSDWLLGKEGGLHYTDHAKREKLEKVKISVARKIKRAEAEREGLKTAVLKAKATDLERNADEDWMRELRTRLMIKEGEVIGLEKELGAIKDVLLG